MIEDYRRDGCIVTGIAEADAWSSLLEQQRAAISASGTSNRPWVFWELHNPWSRAAVNVDSWQLLDVCQAPVLIEVLSLLMGDDIVLFDSQIVPNPALTEFDEPRWRNDDQFFPLDRPNGLVVRLPFGSDAPRTFEYRRHESAGIEYCRGQVLIHAANLDYRSPAANDSGGFEYVVRYFPAQRLYERDPLHPKHVQLTERYPWVNYMKMPLWLVNGEDKAGNDFVTGFHTRTGRWTTASARPDG